jgi:hypothetical protein
VPPGAYRAVHLECARKKAAPPIRGSCEQAPEVMPIGRCPNNEIDKSRKRVRFVRSHLRNQPLTIKSTSQLDSTVIGHSNDTNDDAITATDELQLQDAKGGSNSLPLRSGRHTRLPVRFR